VRTLGTILIVACAGIVITGAVTFGLQYARTLAAVDDRLHAKVAALPPVVGDTTALSYLTRLVQGFLPLPNEAVVGLIDGVARANPVAGSDFRAIHDPALQEAAVRAVAVSPEGTALGTVATAAGPVRFIAHRVDVPGDRTSAIYLRAVGLNAELAPLATSIMTYAAVAATLMVGFAGAGWFLSGRLVAPLRRLRDAADAVTFEDLGARVPETGDSEIADLSRTMNSMLERLEVSASSQRQLLDDIRHELKTPITIVRGHLEVMQVDEPLDVAATRELAIGELDRLTRIVEDIDLLSSAQEDQFAMQPVDVGVLTDRVGALVSTLQGHAFTVPTRAHGTVLADAGRLTQAWLQLADNAAKYSPAGSPIQIGSESDGDEVRLWVRDHGPGIPPGARARVFRRFDRAGIHRSVGGSGLGLAIVDAIAKAHGGSCTVADTPGGGATFTIRIPRAQSGVGPMPSPVRAGDVLLQREATA